MPKRKPSRAPSAKPRKRERVNSLDLADLREHFDEVHVLTDRMESSNAKTRQNIGKIYERAGAALGLTVKAVSSAFRKERTQQKELERAREKGTAEDKESYLKIASAYGDDSPIGQWAAKIAAEIVEDEEPEAEEREPIGGAAERVATVHALRQPG